MSTVSLLPIMFNPHRALAVLVALALLVSACGANNGATSTTAGASEPPAPTLLTTPSTTSSPPPTTGFAVAPAAAAGVTTAPTTPASTTAPPPPTTEAGSLQIGISVHDGVVDGDDRIVVDRGTEIELTVTSDVADEVHVHGYDYKATVTPGAPAVILFVADLPGIYEVELEDARVVLFELEVQ